MRWVVAAGITGFLLGIAVWADTFRPGGLLLDDGLEKLLPFPFAAISLLFVLRAIGDGRPRAIGDARLPFGDGDEWSRRRIPWSRIKPVLLALPLAVQAVMVLLFVATLINLGVFFVRGPADQLAFTRGFVGNAAWISAAAAALAYGLHRLRRRGEDLP
ncbi:MAG: hypothetical protein HOV71_03620 [Hamadaea sp.]|nr:hypothetical protein [Hamadaea sp.]NUR47203.1 hypothetical protein [Hamadaea sp.]